METKFTPGPWRVDEIGDDEFGGDYTSISAVDASWYSFATVVTRMEGDEENKPEGIANSHLIAAAPDLYVACAAAEDFCAAEAGDAAYSIYRQLNAALAKARGETA